MKVHFKHVFCERRKTIQTPTKRRREIQKNRKIYFNGTKKKLPQIPQTKLFFRDFFSPPLFQLDSNSTPSFFSTVRWKNFSHYNCMYVFAIPNNEDFNKQ